MAWMVVHQEVNWSRPKCKFSFNAKAQTEPQQFPHDFVDYAVGICRATRVPSPGRQDKIGAQRLKDHHPNGEQHDPRSDSEFS